MIHNSRAYHILVSIRYDNTFKKWLEINQNNWFGKYRKWYDEYRKWSLA